MNNLVKNLLSLTFSIIHFNYAFAESDVINRKCTNFAFTNKTDRFKTKILGFSTSLGIFETDGVKRNYELICEDGVLESDQIGRRTQVPCPIVKISRQRIINGVITLPPITYRFKQCSYKAHADGKDNFERAGAVEGKTDEVHIRFTIFSMGRRYDCTLYNPTLVGNSIFFPKNFFVTKKEEIHGINHETIKRSVEKAFNRHVATSLWHLITPSNNCKSIFQLIR